MSGSTVHVPESLIAEVEQAAAAQERTPDALVHEALERYLMQQRREKLYASGEAQARKLGIRESQVPELVEQTRLETRRGQ